MDGIVFFGTERHDEVVDFFRKLGATTWLEQPDCTILEVGSFRFGFCARESADTDGILTFVLDDRAGVDEAYERVESLSCDEPRFNETYDIYHFFCSDPEGRTVEFQTFE